VNPVVAGRLRRNDITQITDGATALVLVSERWLAAKGRQASARIAGWGHRTVGLGLQQKLDRNQDSTLVMPHVNQAITDAFDRASIAGVDNLDAIETHDCMTPSEYMAIDHFGITEPGESWKAIEDGSLERSGRIPVNPSGGLIGGGHPVGATGARMLLDATKHRFRARRVTIRSVVQTESPRSTSAAVLPPLHASSSKTDMGAVRSDRDCTVKRRKTPGRFRPRRLSSAVMCCCKRENPQLLTRAKWRSMSAL